MLNNKKRRREICFLISLLTLCVSVQAQKRPPNYSQDDMPVTSFTCNNRIVGGYYADPETDCQMFHVCVNVPGVGIQDFRFLCPNDTTFDQEHQICDDWYNIDCELALYESFDLYRIGVDNEIKRPSIPKKPIVANKGTPIPLGPSSTVKPFNVAAPKKNVYASVNNGISEDEDYYRSHGNAVSDESKVPNDILRGSHSSNFYDSKTKGREDLEDDYVAPNTGAKRQELTPTHEVKKHKTLVHRKLASKRPVSQKSAQQAQQNYNTVNYNPPQQVAQQPQYNQTTFASNRIPQQKYRGNVNFNTLTRTQQDQDIEDYQRIPVTSVPNLYQKINNLTEDNSQERKQDTSRNYENAYNFRSQSKFRTTQKPTTAAPASTATVRLPSTEYLQNIANNYQQPATLINNQLQDSSEYKKPVEYQGYNNQAYDYTYQQFKQPSTSNQSPSTKFQTVSQQYYDTSSPLPEQRKSTEFQSFYQPNTTVFDYYKYYSTSTTSYQKAKNYYTTTTTASPKYDPYATFQKSNEKYEEDEFLKTAPSSNLKPSDLNTIYNQKKIAFVNATLKAAYNIEPHKASYYQAVASAGAPKTATSAQNTYYQPSSTSTQVNYYQAAVTSAPQVKFQQPTSTSAPTTYYQSAATNAPQNNYYQSAATNPPQNNYYKSAATNAPQNNYYQAVTNAPQNNYYQSAATNTPQNYYQSAATNAPQNNYYQSAATDAPQNNYYQSAATNAPQNNYYQAAVTNAPQNYYQSAATNAPSSNYYQSAATKPSPKASYYQATVTSTVKPTVPKQTANTASLAKSVTNVPQKPTDQKSSHDYDYAYYDNGGGSAEYDAIEAVGEEFSKIKNIKHP